MNIYHINKENNIKIIIAIIAVLFSVLNVWPNYIVAFKAENLQYVKIVSFIAFGLLLIYYFKYKNIFSLKITLALIFLLESTLIIYYTSLSGFLVAAICTFLLLCVGFIIDDRKGLFNSFVVGYGLTANILHIPFLNNSIPLQNFYYAFTILIIIVALLNIRKLINNFHKTFKKNFDDLKYWQILLFSFVYLSAGITSFMWDDINSYLYFPLKSIIENYSVLSLYYPSSLVFQNLHALAYASFMGSMIGVTDYEIVYAFKIFNALCYLILFICLMDITNKISKHKSLNYIIYITICASSIWFVEITSNYTDFSVLLVSIYVVTLLIDSRDTKLIKLSLSNYLVFSLFVAISFKSLVAILPIVIIDLLSSGKLHKDTVIKILLIPLFSCGIFIRNYLYSGNPTFPAGNHFWKSPHFFSDSANIVANKFVPEWGKDIGLLGNFFSNSDRSVAIFYTGVNTFYSPVFFALVSIAALNFLLRSQPLRANIYLLFGFIAFCLTILLPGAQYKYFIPAFIYLSIGLTLVNESNLSFFRTGGKYLNFSLGFFLTIMVLIFPYSPYSGAPLKIQGDKIFSANYKNWAEKIDFYERVNDFIGKDSKSNILLFYLQDKLFMPNLNVYEYDWYDYPILKGLSDAVKSMSAPIEKSEAATNFLCRNNFKYVILSVEFINSEFMNSLNPKIMGEQQNLYEINCK